MDAEMFQATLTKSWTSPLTRKVSHMFDLAWLPSYDAFSHRLQEYVVGSKSGRATDCNAVLELSFIRRKEP